MERLLVTGVEGAVGANLALALAERFDVYTVCQSGRIALDSRPAVPCDPTEPAQLTAVLHDLRPQAILHCGPLAFSNWDLATQPINPQREPQLALQLAELAAELGARLTWLTTDAVFCGPRLFHDEDTPPNATTAWATQARAVERQLAATDALVVRTHAYGWSPLVARAGLAERIWNAVADGRQPEVDGRRHATPILASDLAPLLARAWELNLKGLYHISGAERTSPYRFAVQLALAAGASWPRVLESRAAGTLDRPGYLLEETSLGTRRAQKALECPLPLLAEGLARFAAQAVDGWRDRWHTAGRELCQHAA